MAGEEKGYTMLYNKYAKRVYHTVYRVMGNSAETEDIVQEAFCTAFEQIGNGNIRHYHITVSIGYNTRKLYKFVGLGFILSKSQTYKKQQYDG